PALTCPARAGSCELRLGRKKACGAVEQKKSPRGKNGIDAWPAIREPEIRREKQPIKVRQVQD
ncbi:MAG: hypothetical protein ACREMY_24885, partial [bacterium]